MIRFRPNKYPFDKEKFPILVLVDRYTSLLNEIPHTIGCPGYLTAPFIIAKVNPGDPTCSKYTYFEYAVAFTESWAALCYAERLKRNNIVTKIVQNNDYEVAPDLTANTLGWAYPSNSTNGGQ